MSGRRDLGRAIEQIPPPFFCGENMAKKPGIPPIEASTGDNVTWALTETLRLDSENPRLVEFLEENDRPSQDDLLRVLWEEMAVDELVMSIAKSGFMPYEPLLVMRDRGELVVIEGNRRLAAVQLLLYPERRKALKALNLPKLSPAAAKALEELPVIFTDRKKAWKYLGVKHINGPKKWDSYAKAQYIALVADDHHVSLEDIASQIGDKHGTVQRLYRALKVIEQAEEANVFNRVNREKKHFSFSHLETGLGYENIAKFVGLKDKSDESDHPVDDKHITELGELCTWLYGDKTRDEPAKVQTQNPHLRQLNDVLGKKEAVKALRAGLPLELALEVSFGDDRVFQDALVMTKQHLQKARGTMSTGFDGDAEQLRMANEIADLAADLAEEMERKSTNPRSRRHRDK